MVKCTCEKKTVPHKHAEMIKAWADGAIIEFKYGRGDDDWVIMHDPGWSPYAKYRIRPEPKPDVTTYACVIGKCEHKRPEIVCSSSDNWNNGEGPSFTNSANIKFIFDGETGKLKSAEVISS